MPALTAMESRPALGHVNLMIDTFLANTNIDDLRAIVRTTLATTPPSTTAALTAAARKRLEHNKALQSSKGLFITLENGLSVPAAGLQVTLSRARSLFGVGLAFSSLSVLEVVVRATLGLRWEEEGEMVEALADVDADITQAIQSSKDELPSGRVSDIGVARKVVASLGEAVKASESECATWLEDGFPFERADVSIRYWKF